MKSFCLATCMLLVSLVLASTSWAYRDFELHVGDAIAYGAENPDLPGYWNLTIVNERDKFDRGEKVQFLAKVYDIGVPHQWRVRVNRAGEKYFEQDGEKQNPTSVWEYSTMPPWLENVASGEYEVLAYLDTGNGFELLGKKAFQVREHPFDPMPTQIGTGIVYGGATEADPNYWNLTVADAGTSFVTGQKIIALGKVADIEKKHRFNTVFSPEGRDDYTYTSAWHDPEGKLWAWSTTPPEYDTANFVGTITVKTYIEVESMQPYLIDTIKVKITEKAESGPVSLTPIYHILLN